jgi:hypothetical protein
VSEAKNDAVGLVARLRRRNEPLGTLDSRKLQYLAERNKKAGAGSYRVEATRRPYSKSLALFTKMSR